MNNNLASAYGIIRAPIVDRNGTMTFEFVKWVQDATQRIGTTIGADGTFIGSITTDQLTDGTGTPLAGGRAATTALIDSPPVPVPHKFLTGLSSDVFQLAQPDYSDITNTPRFADAEIPAGLINGSNVTYSLTHAPNPAASLILVLAGLVQNQSVSGDYTLSSNTITFATAPALGPLVAWYRY